MQQEFKNFAGGWTDKSIPGAMNRYEKAENLIIDTDGRLIQRPGWDIYSSTAYVLSATERTARLVNFDNDSELLAFQNKKAFYISAGAWTELTGPTSNKAFNTNAATSRVKDAQWNHHAFLASESGDPVIKLYRDGSSVLQLRSAGLPAFARSTIQPSDGGLALAIALANDIRTKMIAHFGANAATAGVSNSSATGHHMADAGGVLAGQATSASATVASTNLATLITLLNSLRTIYSAHVADAQAEDTSPGPNSTSYIYSAGYSARRKYHVRPGDSYSAYDPHMAYVAATANSINQPLYLFRHYLNFTIADPAYTIPSTAVIADILEYVNDLRDKWNWHTFAPMTHFNAMYWQGASNFANLGSHATSVARAETYTWGTIAPNYGPFIQFVKDLKTEYDAHRVGDMHFIDDVVWTVPSAVSSTPTTFQDTVTLMGWLAHCITYHALEADTNFAANGSLGDEQISGTVTSGASLLTFTTTGGYVADKYKYMNVVPMVGTLTTPFAWGLYLAKPPSGFHNISASSTATPCVLTTDSNFTASYTDKQFVLTSRRYHFGKAVVGLFDPRDLCQDWDELDSRLNTSAQLQGYADIAERLALYLKNHTTERLTETPVTSSARVTINNKRYRTWSNSLATFSATGYDILVHGGQDNTNYPTLSGLYGLYLSLNSASLSSNTAATQLAEDRFTDAPTAASFNYKAVFKYSYTVGTTAFVDRSDPSAAINVIGFINEAAGGTTEKGKFTAEITNLLAYSNASNENWATSDTTNFRKEIYRTIGNGTAYFLCSYDESNGDVQNSTTTFSDYTVDSDLINQEPLYTNGGVVGNTKPPAASYLHMHESYMYYVLGTKVYQSLAEDPDSVPEDFFIEFDENVVGVASGRSLPVAFTPNRVYRLEGTFDELGNGFMSKETIHYGTGCISSMSIVQGEDGCFFAGIDGFYYTDGSRVVRIMDMSDTFKAYSSALAQRKAIFGAYDAKAKKIYWTMQSTSGGSAPDFVWVCDLQFGILSDATPFTTFGGGFDSYTGFNPTALVAFGGALHYGDKDGYIFKADPTLYIDLTKNTSVAATSWDKRTLLWDFKSCHSDYGSASKRKYYTHLTAQFDQVTNLSVQIRSDADKGRIVSNLPIIRSRKLTDWGDSKLDWISSVYTAKAGGVIDEKRSFKSDGSLRSNFRAVEMRNAYCTIVNSTDMGTLTLANVAGNVYTLTLTSLVATRKWPLYSVGYYVEIAGVQYPVTVRTSDSVIRIDSTGLTTPSVGVKTAWEMWGYPKNEKVRLMQYEVFFEPLGEQQKDFQGTTSTDGGENA